MSIIPILDLEYLSVHMHRLSLMSMRLVQAKSRSMALLAQNQLQEAQQHYQSMEQITGSKDWLELVLEIIRQHPETLFVIRAHPDEMRAGKKSEESVADWVARHGVLDLPNVVFVSPDQYLSSYELILRSKFVLVYNSSIGLEAALLKAVVLCGGKARYTQIPTAFFPPSQSAFREKCETLLAADNVEFPHHFLENARRFLYYQFYRASLQFDEYLEADPKPGFVKLRPFSWQALLPEKSETMQTVVKGIVEGKPFLLPEESL